MTAQKKKTLTISIMIGAIVLILGISFALWFITRTQNSTNIVKVLDCLNISLTGNEAIELPSAFPITNAEGMQTIPHSFTAKNECDTYIEVDILLAVLSTTDLPPEYIRVSLNEKSNTTDNSTTLQSNMIVNPTALENSVSYKLEASIVLGPNEEIERDLRIWLDEPVLYEQVNGKKFYSKIVIVARPILEPALDILQLAIDLPDGMIPVAYDSNGKTIKADKSNAGSNWYDYADFKWANAVLVNDTSRVTHQNASQGSIIPEADILAYFVWIPRYSYTLFNVNADGNTSVPEQMINVTLQRRSATKYNGNVNGHELTHPAFTFGDDELNGFWVGKFSLSGTATNPTIKPNMMILGGEIGLFGYHELVSSAWTVIKKFETHSEYGITSTNMNSHMIKNIEWGAVAYLSNSQYGQYNNPVKPIREIFLNNSDECITGRSGNSVKSSSVYESGGMSGENLWGWDGRNCSTKTLFECTGERHGVFGMAASTTGNQYGVYDMKTQGPTYVMGNMASSTINFNNHIMNESEGGTSFGPYTNITLPKRYYDIYDYGTTDDDPVAFMRGKLGDGTREVIKNSSSYNNGWFGINIRFPYANLDYHMYSWHMHSWICRESVFAQFGCSGSSTRYASGLMYSIDSFRAVLAYTP